MCMKNNIHVSINRIQCNIGCGFNTSIKLKSILIDLEYIDSNGYVIAKVEEINKLEE